MFTKTTTPSTTIYYWPEQFLKSQQGWTMDQNYGWRVRSDREEWHMGTSSKAEEQEHHWYKMGLQKQVEWGWTGYQEQSKIGM